MVQEEYTTGDWRLRLAAGDFTRLFEFCGGVGFGADSIGRGAVSRGK